jgi:hypothetical protein
LAEQGIAIFLGPVGQVSDEALDLLLGRVAQGLYATEVGCVRLDRVGIELMLANQLAQAIADGAATSVTIVIDRLRQLLRLWRRSGLTSEEQISSTEQMPIP